MKANKKKALAVLCALSSLGAAAALVSCGGNQPAAYEPKYAPDIGDIHEIDPEITLDGKLDDEIYKSRRWLEVDKEHGGETANMRMTSWFGEQGVYMAFDVTESCNIYVNHKRASYLNSGVEMYLASYGTTSIDSISSFEVDLEADGTLTFKRRVKGGWENFATTSDIMAQLASTTKGGDVNTEDCYGYSHELFIPYDYMRYLGILGEDEKPRELYVNPVLISSYSYEGTRLNIDRHWFNTAADQLDGSGWGNPTQNYHFDENGLVSHDIVVNMTGTGGRIGEYRGYNYAVDRNNATLKVETDDGYRLSEFKINGKNRKNDLKDGFITLPLVTSDIIVDATFEKIPDQTGKLKGAVAYGGKDSAFFDDIDVYAFDGSNTYRAEIDRQTGSYEVYVPHGAYTVRVMSATGGYCAAQIERTVMTDSVTADFEIDDSMYGRTRTLYLDDVVLSGGEKEIFGTNDSPIASEQFVYKTFMGLADGAKNISSIDKYVTEQWLYCGDQSIRLQLMNWEGLYYLKILHYDEGGKERNVTAELRGVAKELCLEQNGLYLAIVRDGGRLSVAYLNRSGNWVNIITRAELYAFGNGSKLTRINFATAEGVSGEYPTALYGNVIVQGTTNPGDLPLVDVSTDYDSSLVTLDGLEDRYEIGAQAMFTATARDGYVMKAYLNGRELAGTSDGYIFTVLGRADLRFAAVKDEARDMSINIRGYKFGEYTDLDGVEVKLEGIKNHTATIDKGVLNVSGIIPGEYELTVPGYGTRIVEFGKDESITLVFNMFTENSHWDVREQNGKAPVIYAKDGGASINSASSYGDFYIETTFKYNSRLAAKASSTGADEYTQRRGYTLTFANGRTLQPSLVMHAIQFAPLLSETAVGGTDWSNVYNLSEEEIARYHGAEGIKFGLLRIGRYVTVSIDGKTVAQFTLQSEYNALAANVGLHQYNGAGLGKETYAFTFTDAVSRTVVISDDSTAEGCSVKLDGSFNVGDDVKIRVTPSAQTAGARLISIIVNDKERIGDYSDGVLTIKNCATPKLNIKAKWAKPLLDVTPEYGSWNFSKLDEGKVITDNSTHSKLSFGMFDDFMVRGVFRSKQYQENNVNRQEFLLQFPSSMQVISLGIVNGAKDSGAFVQGMDDQDGYSSPYRWWNFLSGDPARFFNAKERELYFGDGLEMMIVRKADKVHLFIDGKFERTITLDQITGAATSKVELCFKHWLDDTSYVEIPLEVDGEADKYLGTAQTEIDSHIEHGTVTADRSSYDPMNKENVTFAFTPAAGYKLAYAEVGGRDVTKLIVNGEYTTVGRPFKTYATARFVADATVSTGKITFKATDENGNAITVPAGRAFTLTNIPNNIVYTATTTADGKLTFKRGDTAVSEIYALAYDVTSSYSDPFSVDVTKDGAELDISFRTVVVSTNVITDNNRDIRLAAAVGLNPVLAYERWISQWDTAIDTVDDNKLLSGVKYWSVSGTQTARTQNTVYGAITSAGGYRIYGLPGQDEYADWAPVIMRPTESKVVVRKDAAKLRVFAGKWWGSNSDVTFTLKLGDEVYAAQTVTMGQSNGHAIVEFLFDTTDMSKTAKLEFTLEISSSATDGYAIAGLQLLGTI